MDLNDLQNKLVAIVGFGEKEGRATAEYLLRHGITPVLFDHKPWDQWSSEDQEYIKNLNVNFIFGPGCIEELKNFNIAFRNPAFPRLNADLVQREKEGLIITSQTKWFFEHCPATIIGVTGTKGKGTTSTLIYEMVRAAEKKVFLTGNIGNVQPFEILESLNEKDYIVYELSSYQLQDLTQSPHIGVVLMVTADHLDSHKSLEEYHAAKESIVTYQTKDDIAIINSDYPASKKIGFMGHGKKEFFSRKIAVLPGCFIENGFIVIKDSLEVEKEEILKVSDVNLRGAHNLENACAAILAARAIGVPLPIIQQTLKTFKGLEHRLEFAGNIDGIMFYNDSFSTGPDTAIAALESFTEPLILLVGGSSKKADFSGLIEILLNAQHLKAVVTIGEEGERIKGLLAAKGFKKPVVSGAETMEDIFSQAKSLAQKGDVVLLSPAAASFGMFKNYKDRGTQFKVQVLKHTL